MTSEDTAKFIIYSVLIVWGFLTLFLVIHFTLSTPTENIKKGYPIVIENKVYRCLEEK